MIQIYKDRYGNEHRFDTKNQVCAIPGCQCKVSAITKKNFKYSKVFCEKHVNGVEITCKECKKIFICKPTDYLSYDPNNFTCRKCNLTILNKTDKMRK